jgi:hypothetical protein
MNKKLMDMLADDDTGGRIKTKKTKLRSGEGNSKEKRVDFSQARDRKRGL